MELVKLSYRPVSNLPYISKLVEKAVLEQINLHCNTHGQDKDRIGVVKQYC